MVANLVTLYADGGSFWDYNVMELFATIAIIVAALMGAKRIFDNLRQPNRIYDVRFVDLGKPFPKAPESTDVEPKDAELEIVDEWGELHVWIRVEQGINIRSMGFSLVKRKWFASRPLPWPIWIWAKAVPVNDGVEIIRLWDAEREEESKIANGGWGPSSRGNPLTSPDGTGGYRIQFASAEHPAMERLKGEPLWIRVIVSARNDWKGHLSLTGPALGGGRAQIHRSIKVIIGGSGKI